MADVNSEGPSQPSQARQVFEEAGKILSQALWSTGASYPAYVSGAGSAQFSTDRLGMNLAQQQRAIEQAGIDGTRAGDVVADWLHL